ncbi:MAG: hypothetical protein U0V70_04030 [Terriglobia bacterium]
MVMVAPSFPMKFKSLTRMGLWYLCLGTGFFLMGFYRLIHGEKLWLVVLRWLLALGFWLLAFVGEKATNPGDHTQSG